LRQPYFEVELFHKDGSKIILEVNESPIFDEWGNVVSVEGIAHDITENKRMEIALKESESKFRTLYESNSDAIILLNDLGFIDCNPASLRLFACDSKKDFLKKQISDFSPPCQPCGTMSRNLADTIIRKALDSGYERFEWVHLRLDGSEFPAEIWFTAMELGGRNILQAVVRDLTDRKRAEDELRDAETRLMEAEKLAALGALVAGIAHEINNPVGISVTAASHLDQRASEFSRNFRENKLTKSGLEKFIQTAEQSTKMILTNLRRASEQIQSFKQVAVDQSSSEKRQFVLRDYLNEILQSLQPEIKKKNHIIRIKCPGDLRINSYPGAFYQIVTNLVMNSITHGFEERMNGEINLSIELLESNLVLRYSDNGVGIPEDNQGKIFQPFYSTRRGKGGSGIGLHIVYTLVTRDLGGRVSCSSESGKETIFIIEIPLDLLEITVNN